MAAFIAGCLVLVAVALAVSTAGSSPFTFRGVPGAIGVVVSIVAAVLAGPLAGVLVAAVGGMAYVVLVADGRLGGFVAIALWAIAAGAAGLIADRYRAAGRERDLAHAAERRARQAAESESERLAHLQALTARLATTVTVHDVGETLVDAVIGAFGGTAASISQLSDDGKELVSIVARGYAPELLERWSRFPVDTPVILADAVSRRSVVTVDNAVDAVERYPLLGIFGSGYPLGAQAAAPLLAGDDVLGVIGINFDHPRRFSLEDQALLLAIGRQCGQAIERARLFEAVRLAARVERVKAVSEAMNPGLGVGEVAGAILAEAAEALGAAAGGLGVVSGDGRTFEFMSRFGAVAGTAHSVPVESSGPTTEAFRTGSVVRIERAEEWRRAYPGGSPLLGEFAEAVLAVPISAAGRRIGAIGLRFDRERSFSPDELRFVGSLADEAGEALERARLFEAEQRALRRAARLQEVTARLSRAVTTEDAARAILRGATGAVSADAAAIALAGDEGLRVVPGQMSRGTLRLRPPFEVPVSDRGVLAHVYGSGRSRWVRSEADWRQRFAEDFGALRSLGTCLYAVPIVSRGEPIGALAVFFVDERPEPSAEDAELIRSFAQQAGVALERARTYEIEHEAAITLQRNLMPENLSHEPKVEVVGRYLPATQGVHVGGDWYDLVDRPDGTVALAVGDIAGHGLPAAAAMGQVRSAWRALALSSGDPAGILASLDRFAAGVEGAFFSTILTMLLDPSTNELRYASAGHPPAMVIDADRTSRFLEGGRSVPLGLPYDLPRPQAVEILSAGAVLVLYTDGLVERRDEPLDEGLHRLGRTAVRVAGLPLTEVADALLDVVADDRHDDVALLAVGPKLPAEVFRRSFPADAVQLATMRAELRAWLDRSGLPAETKEDVVLACTEAAANAIEHAYIGRDGDILVVGETDDGWLRIEVSDDGRWRDPRPDDARGRGLDLVRTLIGDIDVERGERGTTVRMRVGVT